MTGETDFTYEALKGKYRDFVVPSSEIEIDGSSLTTVLNCRVERLSVNLCLGRPSEAVFELKDCYDLTSHSVRGEIKDSIKLGSKVEIMLGYVSERSKVFTGYIDKMEREFSEETSFTCRFMAADALKLMQEAGVRKRLLDVATYAEAFDKILEDYSGVCSAEADSVDGELEYPLVQDGTDYDFIVERLIHGGALGRELLVEKGTVYYRERDKDSGPVIELMPGQGLKKFCSSTGYVNRTVEVLGYSMEEGQLFGTSDACMEELGENAFKGKEVVMSLHSDTQEQVNGKAVSYAEGLLSSARTGNITTVGLPELFPGNYIMVSGMDSTMNGRFYMTEVRHSLSEDGFITEVTVSG